MKRNRSQYRRIWTAAARTIQNHDDQPSNVRNCDPLFVPAEISDDIQCSSSDIEEDVNDDGLPNGLANWANEFLIKHNALDSLLVLLKNNGHSGLPGSARTLLKTTRNVSIQMKSGMEYVYLSLPGELLKTFKKFPPNIVNFTDSLEISLNIDGLPLFKSSSKCLWPVLCAIVNIKPVVVFPVALAYGSTKPRDLEFLEDVVKDLGHILSDGLQDENRVLSVTLRCVVCDAPARALVKGTKLCSGYFGCDKCAQKGIWVGQIVYPLVKGTDQQTDFSFRNQLNEKHHQHVSPFCDLPIDMIKKFPIDYMHQCNEEANLKLDSRKS